MKLFAKLKESKVFKRVALMCSAVVVAAMGAIGASAEVSAPSQADIVAGVQQVTTAVTGQFNIATIASIIGVVLAGCVGLFLFWWGARKVVRMIASAFKKGKISL